MSNSLRYLSLVTVATAASLAAFSGCTRSEQQQPGTAETPGMSQDASEESSRSDQGQQSETSGESSQSNS